MSYNKLKADHENLEREYKVLRKKINSKSNDFDTLQKEVTATASAIRSEYDSKIKKLKDKNTKEEFALKNIIKSLTNDKKELSGVVRNLDSEHHEELENLKSDFEFKIECLQQEISRINETPSQEHAQITNNLKKRIIDLERNLNTEKTNNIKILRNKAEEIDTLNKTVDKLNHFIEVNSIDDLFSTRRSLEGTLSPKY